MKKYSIFTTKFGFMNPANVMIDEKTGKYYISGNGLSLLVFTNKAKAQSEIAKIKKVNQSLGDSCYVSRFKITPTHN